jgi:acyl carrier protein
MFNEKEYSRMENVLTTVQGAFKAAFDIQPQFITIETKPNDIPGWDSMGHVALVSSLEQAFGLSFDVDEVMEMEDVGQIVSIVEAHLAKIS